MEMYRYWAKTARPLEIAYRKKIRFEDLMQDDLLKKNLSYAVKKSIGDLKIGDLENLAKKKFWNKNNETFAAYHLLPYHNLDVAAVGWALLNPESKLCRRLAEKFGILPKILRSWFCFSLSLHDVGKFAAAFQNLRKIESDQLVKKQGNIAYSIRHDSLGYWLWKEKLQDKFLERYQESDKKSTRVMKRTLSIWFKTIMGHHGIPPEDDCKGESSFTAQNEATALRYFDEMGGLFLAETDLSFLRSKEIASTFKALSWQIAGLAVLCDWLGSGEIFPFRDQKKEVKDYWENTAIPLAKRAVTESGIRENKVNPFMGIANLFEGIKNASPLQKHAENVEIPHSPQIHILEDVTGSGKTEAALILVQRLMGANLGDGVYFALPTMATSNGMYERLESVYQKLFGEETKPSLVLAHGARDFSDKFRNSLPYNRLQEKHAYSNQTGINEDISAGTYCAQWFADSGKKSLLADIGVGTIDQALLAILPVRHQSLRVLGLSGKILVFDEVHAYDDYMRTLLERLLEMHAMQGGSVILLSATLPKKMRVDLVKSFCKGLGKEAPELDSIKYPLATHVPSKKFETPIETRHAVKRTVKIHRLDNEKQAFDLILDTVKKGHCVCWIRNTVKDAVNVYQKLRDSPEIKTEQITLFHSRFILDDRKKVEEKVLKMYGKNSTAADRKGKLLIATQVVEQSLDLDFDLIISDLAPIDLLIQRAGRMRRHCRDKFGNINTVNKQKDGRTPQSFHILYPTPDGKIDANWLPQCLSGTRAVYQNTGNLWRTAKLLTDKKQISVPGDCRRLIETVYGDNTTLEIPDALFSRTMEAIGKNNARTAMGNLNGLKPTRGYTRDSAEDGEHWAGSDIDIPTRLQEAKSVSVILANVKNHEIRPVVKSQKFAWELSAIKIPEYDWKEIKNGMDPEHEKIIERTKNKNLSLKFYEILPLFKNLSDYYSENEGWIYQRANQ